MKTSTVSNIILALVIIAFIGYQVYKLPRYSDGEVVPAFTAELIDGSTFSMVELQGRYVLLDFWGSWCGPCRRESPDLVRLHDKYADAVFEDATGFDIVSIAIETSEENWKRAIKADKLDWPYHIVQLDRFDGIIARQYGVREIPTKYLLDTKGRVKMVNPLYKDIDEFLQKELK